MKLKFHIASFLLAAFLTGCYEVHQGHYVAENVTGWSHSERGGSNFFQYSTKDTPNWFVQMGGTEEGKLHLRIGSDAYDPYTIWKLKLLSFSGNPIRVVFTDQNNKEVIIPPDGFQTLFGQSLEAGDSQDLIVIVPSFKIGDNVVPELSAHLRWSNEKYRVWVPMQ